MAERGRDENARRSRAGAGRHAASSRDTAENAAVRDGAPADETQEEEGLDAEGDAEPPAPTFSAAREGNVRPASYSPGRYSAYGAQGAASARCPAGARGAADPGSSFDGGVSLFGLNLRTIALLAAVAAAIAVVASLAVSCSVQGMVQSSLNEQQREFEATMAEQFEEQKAEISAMMDELEEKEQAATAAQEASEAVEAAKAELQSVVSTAETWLNSGQGQWVQQQVKTMMNNALDVARGLIEDSGVADPQTYSDAADAIEAIMDGVAQGTLW